MSIRGFKTKIFQLFIKRRIVLTKDNLSKRNLSGDKSCMFCSRHETVQHPFLECLYDTFLWWAIHLVLGLKTTLNVMDIFHDWHKQRGRSNKTLLSSIDRWSSHLLDHMASKNWHGFWEIPTLISFVGFIQRNALTTTLIMVAKVWWNQGLLLPSLSGATNRGHAVLCFF